MDDELRRVEPLLSPQLRRPTPVVFVHGYGGCRGGWLPLQRRLASEGYVHLYEMSYNPLLHDLPGLARRLTRDCAVALERCGAVRVHVVGHSLGGVVLRYAVQHLGLADSVGAAVTIASPHAGTALARLGRGPVAAALRPSSSVLAELEGSCRPTDVRWAAYFSDSDVVAPARSARLSHPALRALNVHVPSQGHLSILGAPAVVDGIAQLLSAADAAVAAELGMRTALAA